MSNYGPKVTWEQLQEGVRIYYTGDMANHEGLGTIVKRWFDPKWGYYQVNIKMDDGREWRSTMLSAFQPGPGRRFWLAEDWQKDRERRIAESQERMRAFLASRSQTS